MLIRAVNLKDFSVRTADQPKEGDADERPAAKLNQPCCIAVDKASHTLFVGERSCIQRITADGVVSTLCGDPRKGGYREGAGREAKFTQIFGAVVVGRSLFVSEFSNRCIRRIPLDGNGSSQLFAGTGEEGHVDRTHAKVARPQGLTADCDGNLFFADSGNHVVRNITPAGVVSTVAGYGHGHCDGPLNEAQFNWPTDVAFDGRGRLLVADCWNHVIRSIDLEAGVVTTIAGQPGTKGHLAGPASKATLDRPCCAVVDGTTANVFVSCLDDTIRCVSPDGTVRTVCGQANQRGHRDGSGSEARFQDPRGVALM